MLPPCEIVDCHHHIGGMNRPSGEWEFTATDLIRAMDKNGVAKAIVKHFASPLRAKEDFADANVYVAEAVRQFPDRLFGAVAVNPLFGDMALEEIERYYEQGFRAVKLHPVFHGYYRVDGGAVDDVARLAGDLGLPVLIHSDFSASVCTPYEIVHFAKRFPDTTFVLLHMGLHPELCKLVPDIVRDAPNIVLDTSQTPDSSFTVFVLPVRVLGTSRLLFGSDGPTFDISVNLRKVEVAMEEHNLDNREASQILSDNAHRIFHLDRAKKDDDEQRRE